MARECVWCVFLVLACVHRGFFLVGVGAWVFFSGKQGCKLRGSKHAVGFTFNTV